MLIIFTSIFLDSAGYKIPETQEANEKKNSVPLPNEENKYKDQLYFLNPTTEYYEILTPTLQAKIENGIIVL